MRLPDGNKRLTGLSEHSDWCRQHFATMAEGGVWGVPRSGLVFTKVSSDPPVLELTKQMPWEEGFPMTPAELAAYQDDEFKSIQRQFQIAGIEVKRPE
jgi:hypothetical protein